MSRGHLTPTSHSGADADADAAVPARALQLPAPAGVYLPATPQTTRWGWLPCAADPPVLTVVPGTSITVDTISHEGILPDQGGDPVGFFSGYGVAETDVLADAVARAAAGGRDSEAGPHVVTGPIAVTGARPGDLLAVTIGELLPRTSYGIISSRHGKGLLPHRFPAAGAPVASVFCPVAGLTGDPADLALARGALPLVPEATARPVRFPLAPFLGVIGVATAGTRRAHSTPPGRHGGNLDIPALRPGATLFLPVQVPGAGLYLGDPHFAQGNGEIALTALEAPLRATITVDVVPAAVARARYGGVSGPFAVTPEHLIPIGLSADLDEAVARCAENAIALLGGCFQLAEPLAYAYLSAATDFEISQVVDGVKGVHALIRRADFAAVEPGPWEAGDG